MWKDGSFGVSGEGGADLLTTVKLWYVGVWTEV